jgi:tetratricopeptide (TPR) repeat protein
MKPKRRFSSAVASPAAMFALAVFALPVSAQAPAGGYDPGLDRKRYDGCVRAIEADAAKAEQFAVEWQGMGGGLPARHCQALAQLHRQQFAAAAATLVKAAQAAEAAKSPLAADFWGQAGNAAFLAGDSRGAIGHFTSAITAAGAFAPARTAGLLIDRARAAAELGELPAARIDLDRALALNKEDGVAWMLSAALARRQNDLARASRDISRASTLSPSDPDIMFEQGNIAAANGDAEAARRVWEMTVKAAPGTQAAELASKALLAK